MLSYLKSKRIKKSVRPLLCRENCAGKIVPKICLLQSFELEQIFAILEKQFEKVIRQLRRFVAKSVPGSVPRANTTKT
jgi:hypothetical protein